MKATSEGRTETVRLLLDRGADIEAKTQKGSTALMHAAADGADKGVKLLLSLGADAEAKDGEGRTATALALESLLAGRIKEAQVKKLLKAGLRASAADAEAFITGLEAKDPKAAEKQRRGKASLYNTMLAQAGA